MGRDRKMGCVTSTTHLSDRSPSPSAGRGHIRLQAPGCFWLRASRAIIRPQIVLRARRTVVCEDMSEITWSGLEVVRLKRCHDWVATSGVFLEITSDLKSSIPPKWAASCAPLSQQQTKNVGLAIERHRENRNVHSRFRNST